VYQDFKLVNGTWDVKNEKGKVERVRPEDIKTTGLLTVEGELDDISGSGQTAAAHDLCTGIPKTHQMHYEAKGAGHYGIFSGRRWREMVYPVVKTFILAHQATAGTTKAKAASATIAKPVASGRVATTPKATVAKAALKPTGKAVRGGAGKSSSALAVQAPAAGTARKAPAKKGPVRKA
jgi:poly(3-hydroxybutyrate) depolymerase